MILKYLSPCINLKAAGARILKYGPKPARPSPFLRVRSSSSSAARVLVLLPGSLTSSSLSLSAFFSGPDLHCLASANKLSREERVCHPVQIPLSFYYCFYSRFLRTRNRRRNSPLRSCVMASELFFSCIHMRFIFLMMNTTILS